VKRWPPQPCGAEAAIAVEHVSIHTPDLDDVFLSVTGKRSTYQDNMQPASKGAPRR
jgi:hypothetical protein